MKKVVAIVGPTASGKTKLAINLKKLFPNLTLINGDSVQIFKELNIGSDKLTDDILKIYPHKLISIKNLKEDYSVYNFQADARKIIEKEKYPLIVGGSGFYIKSVLYEYNFFNETNKLLIKKASEKILAKGIDYAKNYILEKDPEIKIDFKNDRKVLRALELLENNIKPSTIKNENSPCFEFLIIYLDIERSILKTLIKKRILNQLENGFLNEVKNLVKYKDKLKNILGYREAIMLLNGELTKDQYIEKLTNKTMQLAKKQKTWFKNKMDIEIFNATSNTLLDEVALKIKDFFYE